MAEWQRLRRPLLAGFALLVLALLVSSARDMDWAGAWRALRGYSAGTVLLAGGLAALSHALYGSFDLLGRGYTGHGSRRGGSGPGLRQLCLQPQPRLAGRRLRAAAALVLAPGLRAGVVGRIIGSVWSPTGSAMRGWRLVLARAIALPA